MPRPTVLTREVIHKIAEGIYPAGNYFEVACELAGISASTGYKWMAMAEGRQRRSPLIPADLLAELKNAVDVANAQVENAGVISWRSAFATDWRATAEYLSRRFPERWKKTERQEVTGKDGGALKIDLGSLSDEELERIRNGENPAGVLATARRSGTRVETPENGA